MSSLANKDSYLQHLAKKIFTQEVQEPRKRKSGTGSGEEDAQPKKKKRKKLKKQAQGVGGSCPGKSAAADGCKTGTKPAVAKVKTSGPAVHVASRASRLAPAGGKDQNGITGGKSGPYSFSAMTLLRQRLHEKMQDISSQGKSKEMSPAVLKKQQRRKYERERKKRRRKELRMKEKTEKQEAGEASPAALLEIHAPKSDAKSEIVFNKVEMPEEQLSKAEKRKQKKKALKGNLTPLTGKNYKQLLSRLETRKNKLEDLKNKDEKKAQELETKMKWTNVLYKAEGVKIRDNEDRLKKALKRKEQRKAQHQKRKWEKRTEQVAEKMQQRQDKRRKNLQKKKLAKVERKKSKARKKGRVLPEDLEKAGF